MPYTPQYATKQVMDSLKKSSLYQIPLLCSGEDIEPDYECMWRLCQWDNNINRIDQFNEKLTPDDFEKLRFMSLKALHDNYQCLFDDSRKQLSQCVVGELKSTSLESAESMYPVLTKLKSIVEMEDFSRYFCQESIKPLLVKWQSQDPLIKKGSFAYVEPIFSQRLVMLSDLLLKNYDPDIKLYFRLLSLEFASKYSIYFILKML